MRVPWRDESREADATRHLEHLTEEERELLVGLAFVIVSADGILSAEESESLRRLGQAVGAGEFVQSAGVAQKRFPDEESALTAARELEDPHTRKVFYAALEGVAQAGGNTGAEARVLAELAAAWGLKPSTRAGGPESGNPAAR